MKDVDGDRGKRRRYTIPTQILESTTITIHTVSCDRRNLHAHHPLEENYLDIPRLFRGDSKASPLRGKIPVGEIDELLEENDNAGIIIHRIYSCNEYHDAVDALFEPLPRPKHPKLGPLMAYFFCLLEDGKEAVPVSKEVTLASIDLKEALSELTGMDMGTLKNLGATDNMRELYHQFYFHRQNGHTEMSRLNYSKKEQLEVFKLFMEQTFGTEYAEADAQFAQGRVTQRHLRKLSCPDEIVVRRNDGQPMAYKVKQSHERASGAIGLICQSWNFDGKFYEATSYFELSWPADSTELDIAELEIYPLQFDTSGLAERLRMRGEVFWQCRQRKYVAYSPPQATIEFQTVS